MKLGRLRNQMKSQSRSLTLFAESHERFQRFHSLPSWNALALVAHFDGRGTKLFQTHELRPFLRCI